MKHVKIAIAVILWTISGCVSGNISAISGENKEITAIIILERSGSILRKKKNCDLRKACYLNIASGLTVYISKRDFSSYRVIVSLYENSRKIKICCIAKNQDQNSNVDPSISINQFILFYDTLDNLSYQPAKKYGTIFLKFDEKLDED